MAQAANTAAQGNSPYSPAFLTALASEAKRSENYWNAAADQQTGADPISQHNRASFKARAQQYRGIYFDAMSALDGLDEGFAALDAYFEDDHLLLWRDCAKVAA